MQIVQKIADYSQKTGDRAIFIDTTAANKTLTLLSPRVGEVTKVKNVGTKILTVATSGTGATIDGIATLDLLPQQGVEFIPDGSTKWRTVGLQVVQLKTAITANSTTTSYAAGTFAVTSHSTGKGKLFTSDGTKWQNATVGTAVADAVADTGALTSVALTDNGGGTADNTVASQAAPVTLTDSTGLSGTHDDTLAATTVPSDLTGGESPTEAEHNALLAVVRVMAQNDSDLAQKVIELVTLATTARNNLKEVTTQLAAQRVDIAAVRTTLLAELGALRAAGIQTP